MNKLTEYADVGRWVLENPEHPKALALLKLISLYKACREPGSYGLMIAASEEIRRDFLS